MTLQVLLVEDTEADLRQYEEDIPVVFTKLGVPAKLHSCDNFDNAYALVSDPLRRYDLIISDTYVGPTQHGTGVHGVAKVLDMVQKYRGRRFCPLIVYSNGSKPADLHESTFVRWADKAAQKGIETAVEDVLKTGIPQIARRLHDELERSAGSFLWEFLEENWQRLTENGKMKPDVVERLIRRRAAIQIGDMEFDGQNHVPILTRVASEYYIYPRVARNYYSLGDVLRHKERRGEFRVVLTPHCHLFIQPGKERCRADYVLTVKTVPAQEALGNQVAASRANEEAGAKHKKLGLWSRSPAQTKGLPDGRHWYLPEFLDIPHSFCDFLQLESLRYQDLSQFDAIATLVPPYAEAMQQCFAGLYASVGIPELKPESIESLLG